MRKYLKVGFCALTMVISCSGVLAIVADPPASRYESIPERNAFGLKPPTKAESPVPAIAPLPKLILTGITTILGNKRALMKAVPPATAPGQAAKEESLILTEGQRQGSVEVLNIDEKAGSVQVNNSGTIMTLTFEKDGAKLPNTPPPTTQPGLPSPTNTNPALPAALPNPGATPNRFSPKRNVRSPQFLGAQNTTSNVVGAVTPEPLAPVNPPSATTLPADLTPEEQAIVLELQRQSGSLPGGVAPAQSAVPGSLTPQSPILPQ